MRSAFLVSALELFAAACGSTAERAVVDASGPAPTWQSAHVTLDDQGRSEPAQFELPSGAAAFALRAYSGQPSAMLRCYAFEDVVVNGDDTWVGTAEVADYGEFCSQCAQRVSVGSGYALSILPSAADAVPELRSVSVRVALRDCATLTPDVPGSARALELELSAWQPPAAGTQLQLPVHVVVASQYGFAGDAGLLLAALETLQHIWAQAAISLEIQARVQIAPATGAIEYSATDQSALVELAGRAAAALGGAARDPRWPVLVFGPCLRRHDVISGGQSEPWAFTPHLPGGSGVGELSSPILVAAERCEGLMPSARFSDAAQLGTVLAHELGHYLGLYHVVEADGRQDALSDTDADDPNLMRATPSSGSTSLSASQITMARRHNAFARPPRLQP